MDNIANIKNFSRLLNNSTISSEMGIEILSLGKLFDKSNYYCRNRLRNDYLLLLTLDGRAWVKEGKREKNLDKGSWFLLRPDIIHAYRDISEWSFAYIHFRGNIVDRVLESLSFFKQENLGFRQANSTAEDLLMRLIASAQNPVTAAATAVKKAVASAGLAS